MSTLEMFKCRDCGVKYNCGEEQPEADMTSENDSALCKWCGEDEGFEADFLITEEKGQCEENV